MKVTTNAKSGTTLVGLLICLEGSFLMWRRRHLVVQHHEFTCKCARECAISKTKTTPSGRMEKEENEEENLNESARHTKASLACASMTMQQCACARPPTRPSETRRRARSRYAPRDLATAKRAPQGGGARFSRFRGADFALLQKATM